MPTAGKRPCANWDSLPRRDRAAVFAEIKKPPGWVAFLQLGGAGRPPLFLDGFKRFAAQPRKRAPFAWRHRLCQSTALAFAPQTGRCPFAGFSGSVAQPRKRALFAWRHRPCQSAALAFALQTGCRHFASFSGFGAGPGCGRRGRSSWRGRRS